MTSVGPDTLALVASAVRVMHGECVQACRYHRDVLFDSMMRHVFAVFRSMPSNIVPDRILFL